jgi:beta-glucuronidase
MLVVRVDNKRFKDEIPTINTDWWNYGGITRDVNLVEVPSEYIQDFTISMLTNEKISFTLKSSYLSDKEPITLEIPELKYKQNFTKSEAQNAVIDIKNIKKWSPEFPKLYEVIISSKNDKISDKIGFKTISTQGEKLFLNGKPLFMRGICVHEEIPQEKRRAYSRNDALQLLGWAKDLGCNMVRLAHYPHNEWMTKVADSLGLIVWSEIPVYWAVNFESKEVYEKATTQLKEMYNRDKNRVSIGIWSVGNETPQGEARLRFMSNLAKEIKKTDPTRLVSAALLVRYFPPDWDTHYVDDSLGNYVDIVAVNEYRGWYGGLPTHNRTSKWEVKFNKPFFVSETGAESLGGYHADTLTRWSEEFQEWYYREQVAMMKRMPSKFVGLSPWILADFRSPKRNNPIYQEGWNNKGLIDQQGRKKKAFFVLKNYYLEMEKKYSLKK